MPKKETKVFVLSVQFGHAFPCFFLQNSLKPRELILKAAFVEDL